MKQTTIPTRADVSQNDMWNLTSLYGSDPDWEEALKEFSKAGDRINAYRDTDLEKTLPECLQAYEAAQRLGERLGNYAFLKKSTDESDPENLDRTGRFMMAASAFEASISWLIPSVLLLSEETLKELASRQESKDFRIWLEKLIRLKPHTLGEKEERILALLMESHQAPKSAFSVLTNVDIDFGTLDTKEGPKPLSQSTFSTFLENPDRNLRERAYRQFYKSFDCHRNTLATLYGGSVNQDVASARIRGYGSARQMALYPDRVPESVYDNLISTVRSNLGTVHKYYELRKEILGLADLRHWDVYIPLVPQASRNTPYEEAVTLINEALAPLGQEYTDTLSKGLLGGWVDRYENKGKRSGAFSSGGFDGDPYILMNYKPQVIRDVFTLAHEGGHSMHSLYSARSNPYLSYNYTIFEAEVASTFNEDLLFRHMLKQSKDDTMRAYLLSVRASDIMATLFRQTMFAEFEKRTHELVEGGTPLSAEVLRSEYRSLLEAYFGPAMQFEKESDLECLRIPHFYNAFYVYKYATGISAALALSDRLVSGGSKEREEYFNFLKSGGSRYPVEALALAGVDMEKSEPIQAACDAFKGILSELETLLRKGAGTPQNQ